MDWYDNIEEGVRDIVRALRNNGINTICSCGHDMYVQFESYNDPTHEHWTVYNVMTELGYKEFTIEFRYEFRETGQSHYGEIKIGRRNEG